LARTCSARRTAAQDSLDYQAQREVFALHEIAQTIGSSLNMNDTVSLVSNKLRAIVPFDTCIIFIVDDRLGKAVAIHVVGDHADLFAGAGSVSGRHHRLGHRERSFDV